MSLPHDLPSQDEAFQHLRSSDLDDPKAKAALKLYQDVGDSLAKNGCRLQVAPNVHLTVALVGPY